MSNERPVLPAALAQIVEGAAAAHAVREAGGAGLPIEAMHTAARRRRVAFGTGVGVAAAAVVGVLVLGAAAAGGLIDRDPVPPVETPDSAGWDVDYSQCGVAFNSQDWSDPSPVTLLNRGMPNADSQALLTITTVPVFLDATTPPVTLQQVGTRQDVVVVGTAERVIVGVMGTPVDDAVPDDLVPATDETVFLTTTAPLFSCQARDGTTRLEPGVYEAMVRLRVAVLVEGATQEQRVFTESALTIPEPPIPDDPEALPAVVLDGPEPECGGRLDRIPAGDALAHVRVDSSEWNDPESYMSGTLTVVNDLPGTGELPLADGSWHLVVTQERAVVGQAQAVQLRGSFPLRPGTSRMLTLSYLQGCGTEGAFPSPLLAGVQYELWALVPLFDEDATILVAGPWPVTAAP